MSVCENNHLLTMHSSGQYKEAPIFVCFFLCFLVLVFRQTIEFLIYFHSLVGWLMLQRGDMRLNSQQGRIAEANRSRD